MIKACIFDLDGTLTDTLDSLVYSVNATLKEMGLSAITDEQCQAFVGNGARRLLEDSLDAAGDMGHTRIKEAMQIYKRIFDVNCTYQVKPYEGIMELLKNLKERNIKTAVLSNKPHSQTVKVVREVIGDAWIDWAQGQQENVARKPDPEAVYAILEKFDVKKEESLYIGDSEVDIKTGHNAGLTTIGVTWGFRSRTELLEAGAINLIDKAEELPEFL